MSEETKFTDLLERLPWRCFHCDFVTTDPAEAQAHFGDRDDGEEFKPICKWWDRMDDAERIATLQDTLKQLEQAQRENDRLRVHIEGLEYQANNIEASIRSFKPFRENNCRTIYDVFCVYDSKEGEALALAERLKQLQDSSVSAGEAE